MQAKSYEAITMGKYKDSLAWVEKLSMEKVIIHLAIVRKEKIK